MRKGKKRLRLQLDPVHSCFFGVFLGCPALLPILSCFSQLLFSALLAWLTEEEWNDNNSWCQGTPWNLFRACWTHGCQSSKTKTRGKNQLNWGWSLMEENGEISVVKIQNVEGNFVIFPLWSRWKFDIWSCPSTEFQELKSKPRKRWKISGGLVCYWCLVKRVWQICYFNLVQVTKWIGMNFCCVPATKMGEWSQNLPSLILCGAKQSLLSKYLE